MTLENIASAFENHFDKSHDGDGRCRDENPHYCYALSVHSAPGLSALDIAMRARRPNPRMRVSTADRLRKADFEIRPSRPGDLHCDIFIGPNGAVNPGTFELLRLQQAFDPPEPNPSSAGRTGR